MALRKAGNHGHTVITNADFLDLVVTELIIWVFGHADSRYGGRDGAPLLT
jgi:hypothetical protein